MQSVITSISPKERRAALLTSTGAKVRLVDGFRKAATPRGVRIVGCDLDPAAVTRDRFDTFYSIPPSDSPEYQKAVLDICAREKVGLIVPTRDGEMPVLAELADALSALGVRILLPGPDTVRRCQDKLRFSERLQQHGYQTVPVIRNLNGAGFPLFVRPRIGSGSRATGPVTGMQEAAAILADDQKLLHPMLDLREYSIDVLSDLDGTPIQAVARRRREVVDGESVLTTVESSPRLETEAMEIASLFGMRGHSTLQAFIGQDGRPIFIEANLRFGGASSLSIKAGLRSPERILDMAFGTDVEAQKARTVWPVDLGLTFRRTSSGDRYYHENAGDEAQAR